MSEPKETWNEEHRKSLEINEPPANVTLRPENCSDLWPDFVLKHGLRQREGERISEYITRFCRNLEEFPDDWRHFSCPETAQALFCLGGFRNIWLRGVVERGCQVPRSVREIKACLVDLIPYIIIADREKRVRAYRVRKNLPRKENIKIYPWDYSHYSNADSMVIISLGIWGLRPPTADEKQVQEPLLLS